MKVNTCGPCSGQAAHCLNILSKQHQSSTEMKRAWGVIKQAFPALATPAWQYPFIPHPVQVPVACAEGKLWVRISAQIYNRPDEYERLAAAVEGMRAIVHRQL